MRRLLLLAGLVGVLVLGVWIAAAGAQEYPPTTIVVGGTSVTRGTSGSGSSLPFTGSNSGTIGLAALCLVAVGLVVVVAARRRKDVLDRA
jgi:LPXTG-motif cell wall-anchored protein